MNQILVTDDNYIFLTDTTISKKKIKKKYLFVFFISTSICIILIFYLFYSYFSKLEQRKQTNILKDKYNITTLYAPNQQYNTLKLSNDLSIIGLIEIPAINISYPILENSNENLLKISVCRFAGPLPNRTGNLCIAGHNYKNNLMFSKLYKLNINDSIYITDLNNTKLEYIIYEKFKVKQNNLACTANTSDTQITLVTCNEQNNKERIIIKAKVKE